MDREQAFEAVFGLGSKLLVMGLARLDKPLSQVKEDELETLFKQTIGIAADFTGWGDDVSGKMVESDSDQPVRSGIGFHTTHNQLKRLANVHPQLDENL